MVQNRTAFDKQMCVYTEKGRFTHHFLKSNICLHQRPNFIRKSEIDTRMTFSILSAGEHSKVLIHTGHKTSPSTEREASRKTPCFLQTFVVFRTQIAGSIRTFVGSVYCRLVHRTDVCFFQVDLPSYSSRALESHGIFKSDFWTLWSKMNSKSQM